MPSVPHGFPLVEVVNDKGRAEAHSLQVRTLDQAAPAAPLVHPLGFRPSFAWRPSATRSAQRRTASRRVPVQAAVPAALLKHC